MKITLRFVLVRGTRRLGCEEESVVRRGAGEVVWYVLGERRVGCRRQPIAAVRREGAAPSMVDLGGILWWWGRSDVEVSRV